MKCDLQKPECLRCLKAGRNCEGYNLLLHWIADERDGHPIRPTSIKRKAMLSPRRSATLFYSRLDLTFILYFFFLGVSTDASLESMAWKLDMQQVDEILARVDVEGCHFDMKTGPFSVFQVSNCYRPTKSATTSSSSLVRTATSVSSLLSAASPLSISDQSAVSDQDELMATLQKPIFPSTIFHNRWPLAAKLFHHYATNITDLLRPFLHPGNFYGTVYIPRAIIGADSLFSSQESEPRRFPLWSNMSIFYSLLSTAAFHLRGINSRDNNDQCHLMENIGRFCRMMAYRHLRTAMTGSMKNIEELQNVMSATLSLITIDVSELHYILSILPKHEINSMAKSSPDNGRQHVGILAPSKRLQTAANSLRSLTISNPETLQNRTLPQDCVLLSIHPISINRLWSAPTAMAFSSPRK